jgi:hypothetical protein
VGLFALLDPDPDSEYGFRSTDLIESRSNTDPDPNPATCTGTIKDLMITMKIHDLCAKKISN